MKKKLLYVLFLFITLLLIINPEKSVIYAKKGMNLCTDIIIPSLFPFFVCSGLLIYSGFCEILSKYLQRFMKPLFNVNGSGAAAFVLGIISGYPLGALTACQLYEKNYLAKTEAERLLAFCNNSGPLFILGAVGVSLYHNPKFGIILYISHILSAIITGIFFRFYKKDNFNAPHSKLTVNENDTSQIFSIVLSNSIQSILTVCGAVLFFSVISNILFDFIPAKENIRTILIGIFEFTTGINAISQSSFPIIKKLILSAGIVGFAGISVHIQVMGIVSKHDLSLKPYILGKLLQSIISMLFSAIILRFVTLESQTFSHAAPDISGAFAMNSLFVILTVISIFFIVLAGSIFMLFKKHYSKA